MGLGGKGGFTLQSTQGKSGTSRWEITKARAQLDLKRSYSLMGQTLS